MKNDELEADFRLVACGPDGRPTEPVASLPTEIAEACAATAELYARIGYEPPWIGYVAVAGGVAIGGGAFVGPPENNRVEIAYFTAAGRQGRGYATQTAQALVAIARSADPAVALFAKTAPEENASTTILKRLGFVFAGATTDHEIGEAWGWVLL